MHKIYPLQVEGKNPERVLDAIKHDIRRYFKRERARALPTGNDVWRFDCKLGLDQAQSQDTTEATMFAELSLLSAQGAASVYVEINSRPGLRGKAPAKRVGTD
jgi:hypothetical protein